MNSPTLLGGIRNFAWVEPGVVARGEQPALEVPTFEALREAGVTAILSLRPDREPPNPSARRPWPEYHVEEEQALAEASGMRFRHVPIADYLGAAARERRQRPDCPRRARRRRAGVYVHCRAGAGRAGLVSGAWGVTRGQSGDEAAEGYVRFMEHIATSLNLDEAEWAKFARRVGQPYVWWALREVARRARQPRYTSTTASVTPRTT